LFEPGQIGGTIARKRQSRIIAGGIDEMSIGQCSSVKLKECVVCMSDVADGVIMPCGHGGICYDCAV